MMKNFVFKVFLGGLVACLASASTLAWSGTLYTEDWDSGSTDPAEPTKWGSPDSVLLLGSRTLLFSRCYRR